MKNKISSLFLLFFSFVVLASCYRMPNDNEYSLVPTTNNPAVTCEKNDNIMPSVKY